MSGPLAFANGDLLTVRQGVHWGRGGIEDFNAGLTNMLVITVSDINRDMSVYKPGDVTQFAGRFMRFGWNEILLGPNGNQRRIERTNPTSAGNVTSTTNPRRPRWFPDGVDTRAGESWGAYEMHSTDGPCGGSSCYGPRSPTRTIMNDEGASRFVLVSHFETYVEHAGQIALVRWSFEIEVARDLQHSAERGGAPLFSVVRGEYHLDGVPRFVERVPADRTGR